MRKAKPPGWQELLKDSSTWMPRIFEPEVAQLIAKANRDYLSWDKFRYKTMPSGLKPELGWALVKFTRNATRDLLPIKTEQQPLSINIYKEHLKDLSFIDKYCAGSIATAESLPDSLGKDKLIINGLIEEAISSSQIEGASTTRKIAKEMIELNRPPKNRDEKMIYNNFLAMRQLDDWKSRRLDDAFLLELHSVLVRDTMDDARDIGRFREDSDQVIVNDQATSEVVHVPPTKTMMRTMLQQLYAFANNADDAGFMHPFVKASILHFAIGYIHPFVDGNGRSARAIFYWFLLKEGYWMFEYLPISLQIKKRDWRPAYDRAFKLTELDDNDVTYFLNYKLKVVRNAIEDFKKYFLRKQREATLLKNSLLKSHSINHRQLELIEFFKSHPNAELDFATHQAKFKVVYQTARTDLVELASQKILKQIKAGRRFVFIRGERFPF